MSEGAERWPKPTTRRPDEEFQVIFGAQFFDDLNVNEEVPGV